MAQWIYMEEFGVDGGLLRRRHSNHYTKPYQSHRLVEIEGSKIEGFVDATYPGYVANDEKFSLSRMMILGYLDAIAQDDLLERRGMKLVVVVETLKTIFLKSPSTAVREFIIDAQGEWDKLNSKLRASIKKVLEESGVSAEKRGLVYSKIGELRRTPFKAILKEMFEAIGFRPTQEEVTLFVKCRDSLIHVGEFYAASDEEQRRFYKSDVTLDHIRACKSANQRNIAQYFFIKNFVARIVLKLLGYGGVHRDHRLGSPLED